MINSKNKGFTIVETMIFLAISSTLFITVALLISGQMAKYQARDALNQVESVFRGVLNDVGNGYYPMVGQRLDCDKVAGGKPKVNLVNGEENRGTSTGPEGCIIAGKSIEFKDNEIEIQTLAANGDTAKLPTFNELAIIESLKETKNYKWGLKPKNPDQKFYILYTRYEEAKLNNKFVSGAQSVSVYKWDTTLTPPKMLAIAAGNANNTICFDNGSNKSSLIIEDYALTIKADYQGTGCP